MRKFMILPMAAALAALIGSAALADEKTTAAATLVDPNTHAYMGTFVESCPVATNPLKATYVGAYLGAAFTLQGSQWLGINAGEKTIFTTTRHANGEENMVYEVGGKSSIGCIPVGTQIKLLFGRDGMGGAPPILILATGTVHSI